jgi:4-amino-4-deoxy-L-arabinose transferase-like glycosyltransferase
VKLVRFVIETSMSNLRANLTSSIRRHRLLLVILFAAFALRAARLDLMAFEMDEGTASILTVRFTHLGVWPLLGIKTSLQFYNSPLFLYVLAPFYKVTTDARFAALGFALFGAIAVYVVYRTGREFFSPEVGLLAAAMMALSPAAIEYSRRLWGHSLIQAATPLAFYFLLRWVVQERPKAVFWLALIIAAEQQFHFSGALLWAVAMLAFFLFRPRVDWIGLAFGLTLGLLGYLPLLFEEFVSEFEDFKIIGRLIAHGSGASAPLGLRPLYYWLLAPTDFGHNNFFQEAYGAFVARIPLYWATRLLASAAWVSALAACGVWAAREWRRRLAWPLPRTAALPVLLVLWAIVPLAAFYVARVPIVAPYFLIVYPAPFLAIAWGAVAIWKRIERTHLPRAVRLGALATVALLLGAWGLHQVGYVIAMRTRLAREGGGKGSYATYGVQREAMRFIARHAAARAPGRRVLVSEEYTRPGNFPTRYWYLLWSFDHDMPRYFPKDWSQAEYWYVIRNEHLLTKPGFDQWLAQFPSRRFGCLRVHVVPRPGPWPAFGSPPSS